jgi:hypothetical protein
VLFSALARFHRPHHNLINSSFEYYFHFTTEYSVLPLDIALTDSYKTGYISSLNTPNILCRPRAFKIIITNIKGFKEKL